MQLEVCAITAGTGPAGFKIQGTRTPAHVLLSKQHTAIGYPPKASYPGKGFPRDSIFGITSERLETRPFAVVLIPSKSTFTAKELVYLIKFAT